MGLIAIAMIAAAGARMQRTHTGGLSLGAAEKQSLRDAPNDDDAKRILDEAKQRADKMETVETRDSYGIPYAEDRTDTRDSYGIPAAGRGSGCPGLSRGAAPGVGKEWENHYGVTPEAAASFQESLRNLERGQSIHEIRGTMLAHYADKVVWGASALAQTASKFSPYSHDAEESTGVGPYGFMTPRFEAGAYLVTSVALLAEDKNPKIRKAYESAVEKIKKILESPPPNMPNSGGPVPRRWWVPIQKYETLKANPAAADRAQLAAAARDGFSSFFPTIECK